MHHNKPPKKGFLRFTHTIRYSIDGLKDAWKYEESFRQEAIGFLVLSPCAFFLGNTLIDYVLLLGSLWFLLIVELLNSAIEAAIDRIGPELHPLSKRAKDIGSAAVMLTILMASAIWLSYLINWL